MPSCDLQTKDIFPDPNSALPMLRCVQVGVGGFGNRWLDAMAKTPSVQHEAIVDIKEEALEKALAKTGLSQDQAYTSYNVAFEETDADFALIVVPPFYHEEVAQAAFDNGLHVLTEKPMAHEMDSAKRMVARSENEGLALMVSQNYRFRTWIRSARKFLEKGELGEISHASVSFRLNPDWGPFRQKMDDVLLIEMSIHHFDMLRYLLDRDATTVYATTWNPSWSWFRGDCAAAISIDMEVTPVLYEGSSVAFGAHTGWNGEWRVECEHGSLDYSESLGLRQIHFEKGDSGVDLVPLPCEDQEYSLLEWVSSLRDARLPETNGLDNLKSLAMIFAAISSKSSGQPVQVGDLLG